jgi:hypothetical protein
MHDERQQQCQCASGCDADRSMPASNSSCRLIGPATSGACVSSRANSHGNGCSTSLPIPTPSDQVGDYPDVAQTAPKNLAPPVSVSRGAPRQSGTALLPGIGPVETAAGSGPCSVSLYNIFRTGGIASILPSQAVLQAPSAKQAKDGVPFELNVGFPGLCGSCEKDVPQPVLLTTQNETDSVSRAQLTEYFDSISVHVGGFGERPAGSHIIRPDLGSETLNFTFQFGDIEYSVSYRWLINTLATKNWMSEDDFLSYAWKPFLSACDSVDFTLADARELVGCFNIDTEQLSGEYVFFEDESRAPMFMVWQALRMIAVYSDFISDDATPYSSEYPAFREYCRNAALGRPATNIEGESCRYMVHYRSMDPNFPGVVTQYCEELGGVHAVVDCDAKFYETGCGRAWNAWTFTMVKYEKAGDHWWIPGTVTEKGVLAGAPPDTGECSASAYGPQFRQHQKASGLAFLTKVADFVLFYARIAWEYGLYLWRESSPGYGEYFTVSLTLARYVLAVLLEECREMVHEMGHGYFKGGGHSKWDCSFCVAARSFQCKVTGALGLPYVPNERYLLSTKGTGVRLNKAATCSRDGDKTVYYGYACDIEHYGLAGSDAYYCATTTCEKEAKPTDAALRRCFCNLPHHPSETPDHCSQKFTQGPIAELSSLSSCGCRSVDTGEAMSSPQMGGETK